MVFILIFLLFKIKVICICLYIFLIGIDSCYVIFFDKYNYFCIYKERECFFVLDMMKYIVICYVIWWRIRFVVGVFWLENKMLCIYILYDDVNWLVEE